MCGFIICCDIFGLFVFQQKPIADNAPYSYINGTYDTQM